MKKRILPLVMSFVLVAALFAGLGLSGFASAADGGQEAAGSILAGQMNLAGQEEQEEIIDGDSLDEDGDDSAGEASDDDAMAGDGVAADDTDSAGLASVASYNLLDSIPVTTWVELDAQLNGGGASNGAVLVLGSDIVLERHLKPTVDVTIDGQGLYGLYSVEGYQHFEVNSTSLTLQNLTLDRDGSSHGGVYVRGGGSLVLDNTTVQNLYWGVGVLRIEESSLIIRNGSVLKDNSSARAIVDAKSAQVRVENNVLLQNNSTNILDRMGNPCGVFYLYDNSVLDVQNEVTFEDNTSLSNGGAIHAIDSTVNIKDNVRFIGNAVKITQPVNFFPINGGGGAIYLLRSTLTAEDGVLFEKNTSNRIGGAIFAGSGTTIDLKNNIQFLDNEAEDWYGGAINADSSNDPSTIMMENDVLFQNNTASGKGGAVYAKDTSVFMENNIRFLNNTTSSRGDSSGAGIYVSGDGQELRVDGALFEGNVANIKDNLGYAYGGGIAIERGVEGHIDNTTMHNNYAYSGGGGLSIENGNEVWIDNSVFSDNEAGGGGGIYVRKDSSLVMMNTSILNNEAGRLGGGIMLGTNDISLTMTACIIEGNKTAERSGGGIYMEMGSNLTILAENVSEKTVFKDNYAAEFGGAVYTGDVDYTNYANIQTSYVEFSGNKAGKGARFPVEGDTYYEELCALHDANVLNTVSLSTNLTDLAYNNYDIGSTRYSAWYTLTYNAAEGVGKNVEVTLREGEITLEENPFTREGYEFVGWRQADSTQTMAAGSQFKVTGSVTLYAQWRSLAVIPEPTPEPTPGPGPTPTPEPTPGPEPTPTPAPEPGVTPTPEVTAPVVPATGDSTALVVSILAVVASAVLGGLLVVRRRRVRWR